MRCISSIVTNGILQAANHRIFTFTPMLSTRPLHGLPERRVGSTRFRSSGTLGDQKTPTLDDNFIEAASSLTDSQLSRAVAQAVRLTVSSSDYQSAFFLVKSLHYSHHPLANRSRTRPMILPPDFEPISFGRPVPHRLAAHALIHSLLRAGMSRDAGHVAHWMMEKHLSIRSKTFNAVIKAQLPSARNEQVQKFVLDPSRITHGPEVLELSPQMASQHSTRFAINLLLYARKSRQRRTQDIWNWLIHTCLLQGEIVVGTLLFSILVNDFALKRQLLGNLTQARQSGDEHPSQNELLTLDYLTSEWTTPNKVMLRSLADNIEATLSRNPPQDSSSPKYGNFRDALQALANLASLLDGRKINFPQIAPLIRTMYSCPIVQDEVWIGTPHGPMQVGVHAFCHSVLKRLISDLPTHRPVRSPTNPNSTISLLPPPDLHACNSLLHYTLRHRLSPALANVVLENMTKRRKPLQPDVTTYNILLRSGSLLRKIDLSEAVLENLKRRIQNSDHWIRIGDGTEERKVVEEKDRAVEIPEILIPHSTSRFSQALYHLHDEDVSLPSVWVPNTPLHVDEYTLTSYVAHLTSTGNPHIIPSILFHLLPELVIIDHPDYGSLTPEEHGELHILGREQCLKRAVSYGPWVFTAFLNALWKARKTGLAERVWLLAKEAERASWSTNFWRSIEQSKDADGQDSAPKSLHGKAPTPWCLPVEAYTIMIQCYASEARKGLSLRARTFSRVYDEPDWVPRTKRQLIPGWAGWFLRVKGKQRRETSWMGMALFREMRMAGMNIYSSLLEIQRHSGTALPQRAQLQIPKPDARFFNAALRLCRRPSSDRSRSYLRRKSRLAAEAFVREGKMSKYWHPYLGEVVSGMLEAGFEVPTGLRWLFAGRGLHGITKAERKRMLVRRSFAFPRLKKDRKVPLGVLETYKERGLPRLVQREYRRVGKSRQVK